jgi:peptidoglycan/xylan/chitin deacetylase (PgdA/CDA1 family)
MKAKIFVSLCLLLVLLFTGCQKPTILKPPPVIIPPDAKLVCIFFDDAFVNQYEVALPILQEYNYKASFAVITEHIGTGRDLMEYMDAGQLEDLARYGMDIASHTKTHPHLRLLSDEDLHDEIFESKKTLEGLGFVVDTLVYPYYEWDDRIIEYAIAANFTCARAGWTQDRVYNLATTDPNGKYHVAAWQITNQDMDAFKVIVDRAGSNSVVSLVYHLISDEGPESTSTPLANFQAQMAYLKSAGFTVIPLPDIFKQ